MDRTNVFGRPPCTLGRAPTLLIVTLGILGTSSFVHAQDNTPSGEKDEAVRISSALCEHMRQHHVLNVGSPVGCDRLRLVKFSYFGFDRAFHDDGQLVVMDAVADRVLLIFQELKRREFPIAQVKLMDDFEGDDEASLAANNTSAFNVRPIAGGKAISLHAFGAAIDINPVQNPYIRRTGGLHFSPKSGADYQGRKDIRPGMVEPVVGVFAKNGFKTWGGKWNNPTDYQHFQLSLAMAEQLAHLPYEKARVAFESQFIKTVK